MPSHPRAGTRARAILAGLILPLIASSALAQEYDPREDLKTHWPQAAGQRKVLKNERDELRGIIRARELDGRPTGCAKQILQEVKWLLGYTASSERAQARLVDLRECLNGPDSLQHVDQSPIDGSFGTCHEEWFFKLDATVEWLIMLDGMGLQPEHPLSFLDRINSPERLVEYLDSIRLSDVCKAGVDHRKEINMSLSLIRLINGRVPSGYAFHPGLEQIMLEYLDERWQNPESGYWGAWYVRDGETLRTDDLSITFHVVSYRGGRVANWPKIVATTLRIRNRDYPCGWLEEGRPSIHHDYDVAVLLRFGWPHMDDARKAQAREAIEAMLSFCIGSGLREDGTFDETGSDGRAEAFYFGVSLLEEIGYFDEGRRFWTEKDFPEAGRLRERLIETAAGLDMTDPHVVFARAKLRR